jgi:hypothetical protein
VNTGFTSLKHFTVPELMRWRWKNNAVGYTWGLRRDDGLQLSRLLICFRFALSHRRCISRLQAHELLFVRNVFLGCCNFLIEIPIHFIGTFDEIFKASLEDAQRFDTVRLLDLQQPLLL